MLGCFCRVKRHQWCDLLKIFWQGTWNFLNVTDLDAFLFVPLPSPEWPVLVQSCNDNLKPLRKCIYTEHNFCPLLRTGYNTRLWGMPRYGVTTHWQGELYGQDCWTASHSLWSGGTHTSSVHGISKTSQTYNIPQSVLICSSDHVLRDVSYIWD